MANAFVTRSTHDRLRDTICRRLKGRTDNKNTAAEHNGLSSTEPVTEEEGGQTSQQTSDFVDGNDGALQRGRTIAARSGIDFGKSGGEGCSGQEL